MLELINIKKDYALKDQEPVHALKGISLKFRANEFVAILGHSGCGKTTLLNITGGLDHYDEGDLVIKGISTKRFNDSDWDTYRNHSVGFVFQSYNLIPHQTIIKNVELALTISGIKKEERIARAKEALDRVGLKDLYKKKPNQLSGGQMQRVAIARALVNNPEIVLADEPTGALDSETSLQIMDLLKEVSKSHLVIMVTHNPELAEKYASRIVRMKDGLITDDSNPYDGEASYKEEMPLEETKVASKGKKKSSMGFFTATALSVSNLISKLKRTILVAVAGSIGIIGVSTILGVSVGVSNFINEMQNDMLSSYPIEIAEKTLDTSSLISGLSNDDKKEIQKFDLKTQVGMDSMIAYLMSKYTDFTNIKTNDINEYLVDYISDMPKSYYSAIEMNYGTDPTNNIFTAFSPKKEDPSYDVISVNGLTQRYIKTLMTVKGFEQYATFVDLFTSFMKKLPDEKDYILSQYDLIGENSRWAENDNEMMLVVDGESTLTDLILAQMGYYPQDEFLNIAKRAVKDNEAQKKYNESQKTAEDKKEYEETIAWNKEHYPYDSVFDIDEILDHEFVYYPHDAIYSTTAPEEYKHLVHSEQVTINLSGTFNSQTAILSLTYSNAADTLVGTFLLLDADNVIQQNQTVILLRDNDYEVTDPNASAIDGRWSINALGMGMDIVITSSNKHQSPLSDLTYEYDATASGTITVGSYNVPINFTSGKISEIHPVTPDYYYDAYIDRTSEMYLNPTSVGGKKMKVTGILKAKESTRFGTLSRGVYYTNAFADKYMTDASDSNIVNDFKTHIETKMFNISNFNAYVFFHYDDYTNDDGSETFEPEDKKGYASALNGDLSTSMASIFLSFLPNAGNNLDNEKVHLRAVSGLKIVETPDELNPGETIYSTEHLPQNVQIYPKNFERKNNVTRYLDRWNKDGDIIINDEPLPKEKRSEITYDDTISMIVSVISTLVNVISIALIAFTSLSLVVSCFMIAVITYISVMERVKEIGVIRSLGGRKKDVSRLFIAENLITGLSSGIIGILFTYLLQLIINIIVTPYGVTMICALPFTYALIMIGISVLLSVISGLIPSFSASKQDPVIALRSE